MKVTNFNDLDEAKAEVDRCSNQKAGWTVKRYTSFEEVKADEYRYWQSRPIEERVNAISELTQDQYAIRGEAAPDVSRLQRTLVRFERVQS